MCTALFAAAVRCAPYFQPIRPPHANRGEQKPRNQPEKVERKTEYHGIYAVPERNGKTGSGERNEAQRNHAEGGTLHTKSPWFQLTAPETPPPICGLSGILSSPLLPPVLESPNGAGVSRSIIAQSLRTGVEIGPEARGERLLPGERDSANAPSEDIAARDAAGGVATKNNCTIVGTLEFIVYGWFDDRWLLPFVGQGQLSVLHG